MTNVITVTQNVVNEIEFYVNDDGTYTGMSQSGLAKLCGIARSTLQNFLIRAADGSISNELKSLCDKTSELPSPKADKNAEIIHSSICAEVIYYYAFESKAKNDTAKYSFKKFSTRGIDSWIKEITGYIEKNNSKEVLNCLHTLMNDVKELKQDSKAYHNLKGKTSIVFPNLNVMLETFEDEHNLLPSDNPEELTVTEWLLKYHKLQFNDAARRSFNLLVSQTYESVKGKKPKKVNRLNNSGKFSNGVSVYHETEFPLLQLCLNKVIFNSSAVLN